jgi:hypothetical protein
MRAPAALLALTALGLPSTSPRSVPAPLPLPLPSTAPPASSPLDDLTLPPPAPPSPTGPRQRGVALGLFAEDVSFSYTPLLEEIAAAGATHVALVVPLYQRDGRSTRLRLHTRLSPTMSATAEAVRAAHRAGLDVTLFPIVRLEAPRPGEWRGTLAPADLDAWFSSYQSLLGDLAAVGTLTGATRLVVGSELSTLDGDLVRWRPVVQKLRALFPGSLVYSSNWDHYKEARVFDLVDEIGIVGYFNLREKDGPSDVAALVNRWRWERGLLESWLRGRPFVFTEVGYRSRAGSTAEPWNELAAGPADLEEQRRGFSAFRRTWTTPAADSKPSTLEGLYIWNWYGFGGPASTGYTPRGKPALEEVKALLQEL